MELYQIILLVLAVIIAGIYIYKRVTGKDILRHIVLSRPVVAAAAAAAEAVYHMWPEKRELKILNTVMKASVEATEIAEKAWRMGNLEKEDRNRMAKALVKDTLAKAYIEITPQIEMIVDGVIEAVCMVLPHENKLIGEEAVVGEIGN